MGNAQEVESDNSGKSRMNREWKKRIETVDG